MENNKILNDTLGNQTKIDTEDNSIGLEDISDNLKINNKANIRLKNPNEVYYEIYKIAKEKAREHKKAAINHYLEAKKIKNQYLLEIDSDNSSDEESDSDNEIIANEINNMVEELT